MYQKVDTNLNFVDREKGGTVLEREQNFEKVWTAVRKEKPIPFMTDRQPLTASLTLAMY